MKQAILFVAGLFAFTAVHAQDNTAAPKNNVAQYTSLGPVIGLGHNWIGNMGGSTRLMPSGNMGIGFVYAKRQHWGWGGQLGFTIEGYNKEYGSDNAMAVPVYLRMPLRVYYFFGHYSDRIRPNIYMGPVVAVKLAEQNNIDNVTADNMMTLRTGNFRTMDFGAHAGAGVNILLTKATWLNLDLVYYQGLTDVVNDPAEKYNASHNLGVSAGILFGIK